MFSGLCIGVVSAIIQAGAFFCSRKFVQKHHSPAALLIHAHLLIFVFSLVTVGILWKYIQIDLSGRFLGNLFLLCASVAFGSYCFFQTLNEIEASRTGSLMGLKIITLSAINCLISREFPSSMQYCAILLATIAALGMNFSGIKISCKGGVFLLLTLIGYSLSDIAGTVISESVSGNGGSLINSFAGISIGYVAVGIFTSLGFFKIKFSMEQLRDAIPYAASWYLAMLLLFTSFVLLGVVYGSIIQAFRGFFSVVIGFFISRIFTKSILEPQVSRAIWIRRWIMTLLMIISAAVYNWK